MFSNTLYVPMGGGGGGASEVAIYRPSAYRNRLKLSEPISQSFPLNRYEFQAKSSSGKL